NNQSRRNWVVSQRKPPGVCRGEIKEFPASLGPTRLHMLRICRCVFACSIGQGSTYRPSVSPVAASSDYRDEGCGVNGSLSGNGTQPAGGDHGEVGLHRVAESAETTPVWISQADVFG